MCMHNMYCKYILIFILIVRTCPFAKAKQFLLMIGVPTLVIIDSSLLRFNPPDSFSHRRCQQSLYTCRLFFYRTACRTLSWSAIMSNLR